MARALLSATEGMRRIQDRKMDEDKFALSAIAHLAGLDPTAAVDAWNNRFGKTLGMAKYLGGKNYKFFSLGPEESLYALGPKGNFIQMRKGQPKQTKQDQVAEAMRSLRADPIFKDLMQRGVTDWNQIDPERRTHLIRVAGNRLLAREPFAQPLTSDEWAQLIAGALRGEAPTAGTKPKMLTPPSAGGVGPKPPAPPAGDRLDIKKFLE